MKWGFRISDSFFEYFCRDFRLEIEPVGPDPIPPAISGEQLVTGFHVGEVVPYRRFVMSVRNRFRSSDGGTYSGVPR